MPPAVDFTTANVNATTTSSPTSLGVTIASNLTQSERQTLKAVLDSAGDVGQYPCQLPGALNYMNRGALPAVTYYDATNGDLIWEYVRDYPKSINPRASRHKNLGIFEDMIYFGAPDGFLIASTIWAVDAAGA